MPRYSFEQFAAVRNYGDLAFGPDGQAVAYVTNTTGQFNVWRQSIATGPGDQPLMPVQLTALTDCAVRRVAWSPDGTRLLAIADHHGTENFQLYEIPVADGWPYPLTDQPEVRHEIGGMPFSPDGRQIAYASNERSRADFDIMIRDLAAGEGRPLLTNDAYYLPGSWSPDGRSLLVLKINGNTDQELFLVDVATGETQALTPHEGEVRYFPGPFHPDGSGFYFLTDRDREHTGLAFYDLQSGECRWLERPDWDVEDIDITGDGQYLAWIVNEGGWSRLQVRHLRSGELRAFPQLPPGVYKQLRCSPAGNMLALTIARSVRPADIYLLDLERGEVTCLTQSFLGGVPEEAMVAPQLVSYPSADDRQIPAFLYQPQGVTAGQRAPVILSIHGGPDAQELPAYNYNGFYQYLLSQGIGILATNIRGSTGYGKSYQKLIYRDWGGAELRDLEHAALYLRGLSWVNADRLGVFGVSFGGFATLSCVARLPQYWKAAVDIVGPSNLVTFTRAVPPAWRRMMKEWVGDPDEDADFLRERSPITYADDIQAPLLVIQGANDPRVVKGESDQLVERLQALGRTVDYLVFEDEGHGFTKTANMLTALRSAADWFVRHLAR